MVYGVVLIKDFIAKSYLYFFGACRWVFAAVKEYIANSECSNENVFELIRINRAGENKGQIQPVFKNVDGVRLKYLLPYASVNNGSAERLIREPSIRARVLLGGSNLPLKLWTEARNHGNRIWNRSPCSGIKNDIPLEQWKPSSARDFAIISPFGTPRVSFLCHRRTIAQKKMRARLLIAVFVGVWSDKRFCRVYDHGKNKVIVTWLSDFKPSGSSALPSFRAPIDGI